MKTNYPEFSWHLMASLILIANMAAMSGCRKDFNNRKSDYSSDEASFAQVAAKQPNILFIVGDDVGYEVLTANGGQSYSTPVLDKLAKNGMRFTLAHSSPMCTPSRVTLLTGKYNFRNYTKWGYLTPDQKTIGNLFSDNGYATCYAGKWQLDGGDASIRAFGWQRYSTWLPFLLDREYMEGSRYKSPKVYQDGAYLPDATTKDKFSDDIFTDYTIRFIDSVSALNKPFFAYYSMILSHGPLSPTPDDPEFATWDFEGQKGDPVFYPSMIKYMDKKIGQILTFLASRRLLSNTVIFYVGDNGTPETVTSMYNGFMVPGGKKKTDETGTNVPLLVSWNGRIQKNTVSNALVDFTDFLPTLADIAGIPRPTNYGILDGTSFLPALVNGDTSRLRKTIYNTFCLQPYEADNPWRRWIQNDTYKLYDTNRNNKNYMLVKISKCMPDSDPIKNMTPEEKALREAYIQILRSYVP